MFSELSPLGGVGADGGTPGEECGQGCRVLGGQECDAETCSLAMQQAAVTLPICPVGSDANLYG